MNTYVAARLTEWAMWSWQKLDGGYAGARVKQFDYVEWTPPTTARVWDLPLNARCIECEEAVGWLLQQDVRLGQTVLAIYRDHPGWSCEIHASAFGISRTTLHRRHTKAHELLWEYFTDRSLGLALPQLEPLKRRTA